MRNSFCQPECADLFVFSAALHGRSRSKCTGLGAAVRLQARDEMHEPTPCRGTRVLAAALHDAARRKPSLEGAAAWSGAAVAHEAQRDQHRLHWRRGSMSLPKRTEYLHFAPRAFQSPDRYGLGSTDAQRC